VVSKPHGVRIRNWPPFWSSKATTTPEGVTSTLAAAGREFGGVGSAEMVVVVVTGSVDVVVAIDTAKSLETGGVVDASEHEARTKAMSATTTMSRCGVPGPLMSSPCRSW
jgi:hypothetical protein